MAHHSQAHNNQIYCNNHLSVCPSTQRRLNWFVITSNTSAPGQHEGVGRCASSMKTKHPTPQEADGKKHSESATRFPYSPPIRREAAKPSYWLSASLCKNLIAFQRSTWPRDISAQTVFFPQSPAKQLHMPLMKCYRDHAFWAASLCAPFAQFTSGLYRFWHREMDFAVALIKL